MSRQSDYNEKQLAEMTDEEMSYLISYTDNVSNSYTTTANSSFGEANATEQSLSSQLMLLNTVILSASLLALSNSELFTRLTDSHRVITCIIVFLQTLSIIAGIISYRLRERFFAGAGKNAYKSAGIAKERKFKNLNHMEKLIRANDEKQPEQSSNRAVNIQIVLIVLSLMCFAALIYSVLYDVPFV